MDLIRCSFLSILSHEEYLQADVINFKHLHRQGDTFPNLRK